MSTARILHYNRIVPSVKHEECHDDLSIVFQKIDYKRCSYFSQSLCLARLEDQSVIVGACLMCWKFVLSVLSFSRVAEISIDPSFFDNDEEDNDTSLPLSSSFMMENSGLWNAINKSNLYSLQESRQVINVFIFLVVSITTLCSYILCVKLFMINDYV